MIIPEPTAPKIALDEKTAIPDSQHFTPSHAQPMDFPPNVQHLVGCLRNRGFFAREARR